MQHWTYILACVYKSAYVLFYKKRVEFSLVVVSCCYLLAYLNILSFIIINYRFINHM